MEKIILFMPMDDYVIEAHTDFLASLNCHSDRIGIKKTSRTQSKKLWERWLPGHVRGQIM